MVTGSEVIMKLDYITQELTREDAKETVQPRLPWREPLKLELQHFASCILNKEGEIINITGMDGLRALRIAEAALKSYGNGQSGKLEAEN